jgi:multiple sugar transport system substrate-binding protein
MSQHKLSRRRLMQLGGMGAASLAAGALPTMTFGQGSTTVRFAFWGPDARVRIMQDVAADYAAKNPDTTVALEFGTIDNHRTKLTVGLASGDLPDVMWITYEQLPQLIAGGHLADVSQYYGNLIDNSQFTAAATSIGHVDGAQFVLTHALQSVGLFANTRILEEAGIPVKKYPEAYTWAEFAENAKKIHEVKGPDFWGTDDPSYVNSFNHYRAFVRQHGEELWTADGDIGWSRETLLEWLNYWQDMRATGAALPAALHLEAAPAFDGSPMIRGLTAYHNRNSNQLLELQRLSEDKLTLMPVPGNGGDAAVNVGLDPNTMAVAAKSPNIEAAMRFTDYMMNNPDRAKLMGTTIGAPSIASLRAAIAPGLTDPEKEFLEHIDFEASVESKPIPVTPPTGAAFATDMAKAIESMAYGLASVDQTADLILGDIRTKLVSA